MKKIISLATLLLLFLISCDTETIDEINTLEESTILSKNSSNNNSYLVISKTEALPTGLEKSLSKFGNVTSTIPEIGIVVVQSDNTDFKVNASKIKGVQAVVPNLTVQWLDPDEKKESIEADDYGNPPVSGDDDLRFDLQWGHDAIDAPEAWNAGYRGDGVRVAVLDTGFDLDHPDLAPNINFDLSKDFTGEGLLYSLPDPWSHGTHTAGTIAAADNAFGTIGVAPEAELVLIKVLTDAGSGSFGAIMAGITYAAENDADVISMSIGVTLSRRGGVYNSLGELIGMATAKDITELVNAFSRAVTFAHQSGATVIASAGNAATDYDHSADLIHLPSGVAHAISISATAPIGWAADQSTNLDVFASTYSNYGQKAIDFAAPGGNYAYAYAPGGFDICTIGIKTHYCYVFDYVYSTGNHGWYWSLGTSMAAPHVAGVAALLIGKNGGSMKPGDVKEALKASADDLGKPGKDDYYGNGRVNAYRAVTQ